MRHADQIIDQLLAQEGFECDPRNEIGDTPLHCAVRWVNRDGRISKVGQDVWADGLAMIQMMLRDGSDPRIRNKQGKRAADLVKAENLELIKEFDEFEYVPPSDDEEEEEEEEEPVLEKSGFDYADLANGDEEEDDVRSVYSGSDSDEEEEWKRRKAEKARKAGP